MLNIPIAADYEIINKAKTKQNKKQQQQTNKKKVVFFIRMTVAGNNDAGQHAHPLSLFSVAVYKCLRIGTLFNPRFLLLVICIIDTWYHYLGSFTTTITEGPTLSNIAYFLQKYSRNKPDSTCKFGNITLSRNEVSCIGPVKQKKKKKKKRTIIFLSNSLNMCIGCSKEPSHEWRRFF